MKFIIRGQKLEVTESIKSYIEEKIGKLDKYFENPEELTATVVVRVRGKEQIVEQIASRSNKNPVFSIHKLFILIVPHVLLSCFSRAALMTAFFVLSSAALQRLLRRRSSRRVNEQASTSVENCPCIKTSCMVTVE